MADSIRRQLIKIAGFNNKETDENDKVKIWPSFYDIIEKGQPTFSVLVITLTPINFIFE